MPSLFPKRALLLGLALGTALLLSACSANPFAHKAASSGISSSSSTNGVNALTGLPGVNGPVLFVKVDDSSSGHPQVGLDQADVVYIEQVEGGLTRLAAVFSNQLPKQVGPVRSARISDIDLMAQYGHVGLAFSGAQTLFLPVLDAANIEDLGADHEPPTIYSRDSTRQAPTNMLLDPQALLTKSIDVEKRQVATAHSVGWTFGALPSASAAGGKSISSVTMKWPAATYTATWSSAQSRWLLSFDGKPDVDSQGQQLGSPTLVIQNVAITQSIYHDHLGSYTPLIHSVGSGSGFLLRDGKAFAINWNRPTQDSGTVWTLANGQPAPFHTGQVWIALTDQTPVFSDTP